MEEGYDLPSDLSYERQYFYGLTKSQLVISAIALILMWIWYYVLVIFGFTLKSGMMRIGLMIIVMLAIVSSIYRVDKRIVDMWYFATRKKRLNRYNKAAREFVGTHVVEHDHYYTELDDVCAIMELRALSSYRLDPEKEQIVKTKTKEFLNSLPCKIGLYGYNFDYSMEDYFKVMMKNSRKLSKKNQMYLIDHLDFYRKYCKENEIKKDTIYMVLSVPVESANPIETLNTNCKIVTSALLEMGVAPDQLVGDEISNLIIAISTGFGVQGIDYLSIYTDVVDE